MKQTVRIIGGQSRGRKIHFPAAEGLRPTSDRIRETLFNWLMNDIRGSRCLDAFAGSGALGFEALSRGAAEVVMLEYSNVVFKQLKQTAKDWVDYPLRLFQQNALNYLANEQHPFDFIFLDPPFQSQLLMQCLEQLKNAKAVHENTVIYVESDQPLPEDSHWNILKMKKAGAVYFGLLQPNIQAT